MAKNNVWSHIAVRIAQTSSEDVDIHFLVTPMIAKSPTPLRVRQPVRSQRARDPALPSPWMAGDTHDPAAPTFLQALPLARAAFAFARHAHDEHRRASDAALLIIHPLEVASLLHNVGYPDHVVAAGILHDTIEDGPATIQTIEARFGEEIAAIVAAMTEDATIEDFGRRKAALRRQIATFGPDASAVYAADKVAKVRELRSRATREQRVLDADNTAGQAKLEHYLASLRMLEQIDPEHPLVRQLRFELEILQMLPPRPDLLGPDRP